MTGFAANQADLKTDVPALVQQAVVDKVTGLTAAQAITAALFERDRTGRGQVIEIPMLYAALAFLWPDVSTNFTMRGEFDRLPSQSRTFRLTTTADGHIAMITVTTPQWDGLLAGGRARRARRQPRSRHATEARAQRGRADEGDRGLPRRLSRATRSSRASRPTACRARRSPRSTSSRT